MANRRQVTCIKINEGTSPNTHEHIEKIGGPRDENNKEWIMTQTDAINAIEHGTHEFYVSVNGSEVNVIISTNNGRKYLKTSPDGDTINNLLSLRDCGKKIGFRPKF